MKQRLIVPIVWALFFLISDASHADASPRYPKDVNEFLSNREACDHFRGEVIDPPDAELKKELRQNIATYCTGTDKQLAKLKRQYAHRRDVMKALSELDVDIEAHH